MHEPGQTTAQILAEVIEKHAAEVANRDLVINGAKEAIQGARGEGLWTGEMPDALELELSWLERELTRLLRQGQVFVKKQITADGSHLDLGDDFDVSFTVCGKDALVEYYGVEFLHGRVITLGSMTSDDIRLMALEQDINLRKQVDAHRRDQPRFAAAAARLTGFSSYRHLRAAEAAVVS